MKDKLFRILGFVWSSPITVVALVFYILPLWALGYYRFYGTKETALVWMTTKSQPAWLDKLWNGWAGQALGNVVVLAHFLEKSDKLLNIVLTHELEHTKQCMKLGLFQPLLYLVFWITGKIINNCDGYYDNIFEIAARRSAGQTIDVVGLKKRLESSLKK